MVTRSEIDMVQIKQEFQKKYGKTLHSFIAVSRFFYLYFVLVRNTQRVGNNEEAGCNLRVAANVIKYRGTYMALVSTLLIALTRDYFTIENKFTAI